MSIKEDIYLYLKTKGIKPTKSERDLGWGVGALTKAKSITAERLKEFSMLYTDLSTEWLLRGNGNMLISENTNSDSNIDRINKLVDTITTLQDAINEKTKTIKILEEEIRQLKLNR